MKTIVSKWGNSLALRIPKAIAESHAIEEGSSLEITDSQDGIIIRPISEKPTLDSLLSGITKENLQTEISTGDAQGKEFW